MNGTCSAGKGLSPLELCQTNRTTSFLLQARGLTPRGMCVSECVGQTRLVRNQDLRSYAVESRREFFPYVSSAEPFLTFTVSLAHPSSGLIFPSSWNWWMPLAAYHRPLLLTHLLQ